MNKDDLIEHARRTFPVNAVFWFTSNPDADPFLFDEHEPLPADGREIPTQLVRRKQFDDFGRRIEEGNILMGTVTIRGHMWAIQEYAESLCERYDHPLWMIDRPKQGPLFGARLGDVVITPDKHEGEKRLHAYPVAGNLLELYWGRA